MRNKKSSGLRVGRLKTRILWGAGALTLVGVLGGMIYKLAQEGLSVRATSEITPDMIELIPNGNSGVINSEELDAESAIYTSASADTDFPVLRAVSALPAYYNSHDYYNTYTRIKNQHSEGLCWAYAASTTLEYALEKSYTAGTIAPKQMDYQFVSASDAYKATDVAAGATNTYYDRWLTAPSGWERTLGDGGNVYTLLLSLSNPLALTSETNFVNTIKANDANISSIEKYEDIWSLENYEDLLTDIDDMQVYTVKQDYNGINNADNADYLVTGAKIIYYPYYGASTIKTEVVNKIKQAVHNYGAVEVFSFFDPTNCMHYGLSSDYNDFYATIIDRSSVTCKGGHAMTIIGWDDEWSYEDNGVEKTGAFIIQNSYGETQGINLGGTIIYPEAHYYMSYDSAFTALYFDSLERSSAYDNIYSVGDYRSAAITPDSDEYVFELSSGGYEKIVQITFNETLGDQIAYDVYLSTTGLASDFEKIGEFTSAHGMNKYVLEDTYIVNGNYAIKLEHSSGAAISGNQRALDVLNVFTQDVTVETLTASFDMNGGNGTVATQSCLSIDGTGCSITIPGTRPTLTDKKFLGWAESASATAATKQPGARASLTTSVTYYAVWVDDGAVTWKTEANHTKGSGEDMVLRINYPLSSFRAVEIDGVELASDKYELESGSTIITIYGEHLDTLEAGTHAILARFENNLTAGTTFEVEEDLPVPSTSDDEETNGEASGEPTVPNTASAPDTGSNTNIGSGLTLVLCTVPLAVAMLTFVIRYYRGRAAHRKFDC